MKTKKQTKNQKKYFSNSFIIAVIVVLGIAFAGTYYFGASHAARNSTPSIAVNSIGFSPSGGKTSPGASFSVTVLANSGTEPVNTIQAKVLYDTSRLQLQSLEETGAFDQIAATDTATDGIVQIARAQTGTPVSGVIAVVKLQFLVKNGVNGGANLSFDPNSTYVVGLTSGLNILSSTGTATYTIRGK